jgi:hypothetical protein
MSTFAKFVNLFANVAPGERITFTHVDNGDNTRRHEAKVIIKKTTKAVTLEIRGKPVTCDKQWHAAAHTKDATVRKLEQLSFLDELMGPPVQAHQLTSDDDDARVQGATTQAVRGISRAQQHRRPTVSQDDDDDDNDSDDNDEMHAAIQRGIVERGEMSTQRPDWQRNNNATQAGGGAAGSAADDRTQLAVEVAATVAAKMAGIISSNGNDIDASNRRRPPSGFFGQPSAQATPPTHIEPVADNVQQFADFTSTNIDFSQLDASIKRLADQCAEQLEVEQEARWKMKSSNNSKLTTSTVVPLTGARVSSTTRSSNFFQVPTTEAGERRTQP